MKTKSVYQLGFTALVASFMCLTITSSYVVSEPQIFCVKSKSETFLGGKPMRFVVTEDEETLEVSDSTTQDRHDSEQRFKYLQPGQCYQSEMQGFNIHILSLYKNILNPHQIGDNNASR